MLWPGLFAVLLLLGVIKAVIPPVFAIGVAVIYLLAIYQDWRRGRQEARDRS